MIHSVFASLEQKRHYVLYRLNEEIPELLEQHLNLKISKKLKIVSVVLPGRTRSSSIIDAAISMHFGRYGSIY
jgi:hypothetical protein